MPSRSQVFIVIFALAAAGCGRALCSSLMTRDACDARGDCHSVFQDLGVCGCAPAGCCTMFSRCAEEGKARCSGMIQCRVAPPICAGPYVVSYTDTCYEGCALSSECSP
jgi:hypothetical protein